MKLNLFIIGLLSSLTSVVTAQTGSVTIHKDQRLDQKIADYGLIVPPNTTPQIDGYRVQLTFEQSREAIETAKAKFSAAFPEIDTYVIYKAPNFFLKAGDFRTYNEAEKVKSKIEIDFPTSNVVREKINLPKIK